MCNRYISAKEKYASIGVDTDEAIRKLSNAAISIHCWQGDDVCGFENADELSGGIAVTGNYPGKARNPEELMADIDKVLSLIPGKHRLNLHAIYAITDKPVSRDAILPEHFDAWLEFAQKRGMHIDFNPTFFSHDMVVDGLTLSSPIDKVRNFWIRHAKACRKIAAYIGEKQGSPCLCNIWIPDGYKNVPADRLSPRRRLKESLDEIFAEKMNPAYIIDSVESKVFGIGCESYTVGSNEFYMNYAAKNNILCLMDNGHYHPTEVVSDKLSAMYLFFDKVALHVTHPVRWDSDHIVHLDDETREIAKEIIACDALDKTLIGLDYFDASVNRISAWVVGIRNFQKALLFALLTPTKHLAELQNAGRLTELMVESEELKLFPAGDIWDEFCRQQGAPLDGEWFKAVKEYEEQTLLRK